MLLFNLWINPVVCCCCFFMLVLIIDEDYYFWNRMHLVSFRQGMPLERWGPPWQFITDNWFVRPQGEHRHLNSFEAFQSYLLSDIKCYQFLTEMFHRGSCEKLNGNSIQSTSKLSSHKLLKQDRCVEHIKSSLCTQGCVDGWVLVPVA